LPQLAINGTIVSKKFRFLDEQMLVMVEAATFAVDSVAGAEICGLLVDNGYFIELIKVTNKSKRWGSFSFYANEIRLIAKAVRFMNHEIIGTFHSHPFGISEPSESDILNTHDDSFMLIIDVRGKELGFWYIKDSDNIKTEFELITSDQ
jgi:proteasome lid subunit RPN8/RPN11